MFPYYLYYLISRTLDRVNRSNYSWIKFMLKYYVYRANIRCLRNCEYLDPSTRIEELVGVVHFNAPDYLSLLLNSLKKFMGDPWIIIIDNGSYEVALKAVEKLIDILSRRIILLRNTAHSRRLKDHTLALNHLIYIGCKVGAERLIILDQDAILVDSLDDLRSYIPQKAILAGVRDTRNSIPLLIHPSLMILDPRYFCTVGGNASAYGPPTRYADKIWEPYYGISYRALGKIIYIDNKRLESGISAYYYKGRIVAYHAWYSSRVFLAKDILDGFNVKELLFRRKKILELFRKILEVSSN